ncbi:uroporphyrinogen-III synthase isoform X3 [Astyanax mexicanus]|uniref:uroporphyrinogen-III synthase isoform X3 n=1 Tax=Astyanax mexicanus TaxID=7994 RepID=UPI0020CB53BD|nr:uroporphyrinogen-III synthase isoform X3 [Astyanax mexicanus]
MHLHILSHMLPQHSIHHQRPYISSEGCGRVFMPVQCGPAGTDRGCTSWCGANTRFPCLCTVQCTTAKMNVLLLKEPRESESGPDPYIKELALYGHSATLIPVLSFKFVSLNVLSDKLFQPEKHGGLIFTSPRAVEAVKMCLESSSRRSEWDAVKDQWNRKSVYVVGKATASLVEDLGLTSCGENSGTADVLSRLIIEREGPEIQPLLFPCGSLKREVLPTALRQNVYLFLSHTIPFSISVTLFPAVTLSRTLSLFIYLSLSLCHSHTHTHTHTHCISLSLSYSLLLPHTHTHTLFLSNSVTLPLCLSFFLSHFPPLSLPLAFSVTLSLTLSFFISSLSVSHTHSLSISFFRSLSFTLPRFHSFVYSYSLPLFLPFSLSCSLSLSFSLLHSSFLSFFLPLSFYSLFSAYLSVCHSLSHTLSFKSSMLYWHDSI